MTNIQALKKILEPLKNEEAMEFLEAIEKEVDDLRDRKSKLYEEKRDLESEIMRYENDFESYEFLGLDTIHYSFDLGNMVVRSSFDRWIAGVKQNNLAGTIMP